MGRSGVVYNLTVSGVDPRQRISNVAWLKKEDHAIIQNINNRIEDMTGLTTKTAEDLQVTNYGAGGFFAPHNDYISKNPTRETGRIATVLFYVSIIFQ